MRRPTFLFASAAMLLSPFAYAPSSRPAITNLTFVRFHVSDVTSASHFYGETLGLPRLGPGIGSGEIKDPAFFVNPYQHLEIKKGTLPNDRDLIDAIGIQTADTKSLRQYLLARGLIPGDLVADSPTSSHFEISDPGQHRIIFASFGGFGGDVMGVSKAVSNRLIHSGFIVRDRAAMEHFYKDILGFKSYWRGGMKENQTDWLDLQVPDGTDWIEFMLNVPANADKHTLGVMNHIALGVPDIHAAAKQLLTNGMKLTEEPKIGRDGKWQLNLYDPDDTRVELMEFTPVQKPCCSEYTGPHPKP